MTRPTSLSMRYSIQGRYSMESGKATRGLMIRERQALLEYARAETEAGLSAC